MQTRVSFSLRTFLKENESQINISYYAFINIHKNINQAKLDQSLDHC